MSGSAKFGILILILAISAGAVVIFFDGRAIEFVQQVVPIVPTPPPDPNADIAPQKPLANPPKVIKALYATNWSASSGVKLNYFFDLLETTELNAIVLDIKDYTGVVGYPVDIPAVAEYGAFEKRIPKINALIKRFHDAGVYVIGRIAVFQDNALVKARPDLALKSKATGAVWSDRNKVHWLDTAATPVWDYTIDIARDALARGFDEINLDYIRFATDGDLDDIAYPYYATSTPKHVVLRQFFDHVRSQLPYAKISADIFGEAVVNYNQTTIGQYFEDTLEPFDAVAPMIYPSHYNKNFLGLANSAAEPYAVIRYSMDRAFDRMSGRRTLLAAEQATSSPPVLPAFATLRPWLQDFNLGATYDAAKVRAQITAVDDSARAAAGCPGVVRTDKNNQVVSEPAGPRPACAYEELGWMLWNASNVYTRGALLPESAVGAVE